MASIRQINGRWQVQVRRVGVRRSRTFASRAEAEAWAHSLEAPLRPAAQPAPGALAPAPSTFGAVVRRYQDQELPKHRSGASEVHMLNHLHRHWLAAVPCAQLSSVHLAAYRDERLKQVKPGTVRRTFNLLRPMLDIAREEWGAQVQGNPARTVSVRVGDDSRTERFSRGQWQRFLAALRRRRNPEVLRAVELALETSMRRSELLNLTWEEIDLEAGTAHLPITKNGHPRTVALSPRAIALLLAGPTRQGAVLQCSANAIKCAFARARAEAGLETLCFHQARHEAISRMWEVGLNETEIANQSGHRDWKMLRRYSHVQAETLADKLQALQAGATARPSCGDG
jgi:integrase